MNKIFLFMLLAVLVTACLKEDTLTPSEIKNWYLIEPTENMDEVDQKIYDIFLSHKVATFYRDTIGSEDRGWVDTLGNPKLYYEVIDLNYDMTSEADRNFAVTWEVVDVSKPENKAKMMPMLELLDQKLLKMLEGADVYIPAIFIPQWIKKSKVEKVAHRGFNLVALSMNGMQKKNFDEREFCFSFLHEVCTKALENTMDDFYDVMEYIWAESPKVPSYMKEYSWGLPYSLIEPEWDNVRGKLEAIESTKELIAYQESLKKAAEERLQEEGLTTAEREKLEGSIMNYEMVIEILSEDLKDEDSVRKAYEEISPCNYGWLGPSLKNASGTPNQIEDLQMFMDAVFTYTQEEFYKLYADYEYVQARYKIMEYILTQKGFNIPVIRELVQKQIIEI